MKKPDYSNDLNALDGGVMGEGGCPSRAEVKNETQRLSPYCVLTVGEYRRIPVESQENTLRNHLNILIVLNNIDNICNNCPNKELKPLPPHFDHLTLTP
jgi:hypothetical protein